MDGLGAGIDQPGTRPGVTRLGGHQSPAQPDDLAGAVRVEPARAEVLTGRAVVARGSIGRQRRCPHAVKLVNLIRGRILGGPAIRPVPRVSSLPCHVWIVSHQTDQIFSAVRRCSVRLRSLLYAAEVALKLQLTTSTGGFSQVRFGGAESVLALEASFLGGISTRAVISTTCTLLLVF